MNIMKKFDIKLCQNEGFFSDFHVHTNFIHGKNSIRQCVEAAKKNGLKAIGIVEHIRKKPTYDFNQLYLEVRNEREQSGDVKILLGIEAKIISDKGNLDIDEDLTKDKRVDFIVGVFHRWISKKRPDADRYLQALENIIVNGEIDVWGHPFLGAENFNLKIKEKEVSKIAKLLKKYQIICELNLKHRLPTVNHLEIFVDNGIKFIIGSDAHQAKEIWDRQKPDFIPLRIWRRFKKNEKKNFNCSCPS